MSEQAAGATARRGHIPVAALLVALAVAHRVAWLPWQWNYWLLDALNYYADQAQALRDGRVLAAAFAWQGLHPPGSGWIVAPLLAVEAPLPILVGASVAAYLLAALLLARSLADQHGPAPALVLLAAVASSALLANYSPWVGPYPYWTLGLAAATAWSLDGVPRLRAGLAAAWAILCHVLALPAVAVLVCVMVGRAVWGPAERRLAPGPAIRASIPVVAATVAALFGAAGKGRDPWTFHVGESEAGVVLDQGRLLADRFGAHTGTAVAVAAGVVACVAAVAARSTRSTAVLLIGQAAAIEGALLLFMVMGVADSRQTQYHAGPLLLLLAAASLGVVAVPPGRRRLAAVAVAAAVWIGHAGPVGSWLVSRLDEVRSARGDPTVLAAAQTMSAAAPGEVVLWIWDASFLNDEPEWFDPFAQRWPIARLGRLCWDWRDSRLLCHTSEGVRWFFSPNPLLDDLETHEEILRLAARTAAHRLTIVALPKAVSAVRPWVAETWLRGLGARVDELPAGNHGAAVRLTLEGGALRSLQGW